MGLQNQILNVFLYVFLSLQNSFVGNEKNNNNPHFKRPKSFQYIHLISLSVMEVDDKNIEHDLKSYIIIPFQKTTTKR